MTEIVIILDKSGSMNSIKSDAIGGFNQFISEQKQIDDDTTATLVLFDSQYTKVYENIPLKDVSELTEETYRPSSMTALYDAIGLTIESISQRKKLDDRVLSVIITDGQENRSTKYTQEAIFNMIEDSKNNGWEFIFLAANQDAIKAASSINISANNSMNYSATTDGMRNTYTVASVATKMYRMSKDLSNSNLVSSALNDLENKK